MNKLTPAKTFFVCLIAGVTTGMGNGSVFGAAVMCAVGRGKYDSWGGWGMEAYDYATFSGFVDTVMFVFGATFATVLMLALIKHGSAEARKG